MRQIIKTGLFAIASLLFSIASHAQQPVAGAQKDQSTLSVNIHPLPGLSKIRVIVLNPVEKKASLEIKNKKGEILYEEIIKSESFCRDLSFGNMSSDQYTIFIKSKNYLYSHDLYLKDKVIEKKVDLLEGSEVAIVSK